MKSSLILYIQLTNFLKKERFSLSEIFVSLCKGQNEALWLITFRAPKIHSSDLIAISSSALQCFILQTHSFLMNRETTSSIFFNGIWMRLEFPLLTSCRKKVSLSRREFFVTICFVDVAKLIIKYIRRACFPLCSTTLLLFSHSSSKSKSLSPSSQSNWYGWRNSASRLAVYSSTEKSASNNVRLKAMVLLPVMGEYQRRYFC